MKIKIVNLVTGLNQGGAETMLYKLLSNIDREQFQPIVISMMDEGVFGEKIKKLGIPVYCLGMRGYSISNIRHVFRYLCIIRKCQPDIIQSWMYHANVISILMKPFFLKARYSMNIRAGLSKPSTMKRMTRLMVRINGLLSKHADCVINNSSFSQKQHWRYGFSEKLDSYIPNGFDVFNFKPDIGCYQSFREEYSLSYNCKVVGLFARFHRQKNHQGFLRVASLLLAKTKIECRFVLAGTNCNVDNVVLREMIIREGLQNHIILLGAIDSAKYMPCLDVYLSTSYSEGFPNVLGEAMACGVPCVATNVGECKKIVDRYGYIAEVDDDDALAEHCVSALDCEKHKKNAMIKHIKTHYSIGTITKKYEKLYQNLRYGSN